ncbi:MAG TPA: hypothetical protein VN612_04885 [Acidobacteriaceae bacterium]|nr:hypothetical protein [Acidobacteriaceae bacterium]
MRRASPYRSLPLLVLLAATPNLRAQPPQPLTLDNVVAKLQANLDEYEASIPSFLADEHMDSTMRQFVMRGASAANYETIAESVFRLKRDIDSTAHTQSLDESREIKTIDGKPANGRQIDAPTMLSGAFSGGLAIVSKDEQRCMQYTLDPVKPRKPIVVRFVSLPADQRPKDCILREDGTGRVVIDPRSMQITRLQVAVPRHLITPLLNGGRSGAPTFTRWRVQVDYKPVVLDARTFWLPSKITSSMSNEQTAWSFLATYRNYHKLEVRSRVIIPGDAPRQ